MSALTPLELAAIRRIAFQYPLFTAALEAQLHGAVVRKRDNTGAGFYTTLVVPPCSPAVELASPIGNVMARIEGLERGIGLTLWLDDGRMVCLEGFSFDESTVDLDLANVSFALEPEANPPAP